MRWLCLLILLFGFITIGHAATFAERVAISKQIESQKDAKDYLYGSFFPAIGSSMNEAMKMCLNRSGASTEKFTLVANISLSGKLIDIDFEPKENNTAACFAKEAGSWSAPPPPWLDGYDALPISMSMNIVP
ncbi:MAG: hypothetical protein LBE24_03670 [Methylobacillus sp.]|jgi:hypothetical protein|nr:hypothetical protein [Methylobacillus sp.]